MLAQLAAHGSSPTVEQVFGLNLARDLYFDPSERERSVSQSETVLRYGVGTQFELSDCSGLRLEWQRQEDIGKAFMVGGSGTTGEAPTDAVLVGFYYRF